MNRRLLRTSALLGALLLCGLGACACEEPAAARPNLVLISIDTLRPDHLACYGGKPDVGRALCALADDGVRYAWAFATAPSTAPSVASILTSRLPRDHGVDERARSRLAGEVATLSEHLQAAGYATGAFVANPVLSSGRGFERGFSVYDDHMQRREGSRPLLEREAAELTDAALAWTRVARPPWFLWIHYQDPHGPYWPPDGAQARDAAGARQLPFLADHSGWHGIPRYQAVDAARAPETYVARYDEEIRWLDRHIERLVTALDARPPRPAILLTADHGEAFGEDSFWFAHGHSLGIDQIRVPLLWRPARPAAGRVETTPASNLDVAPTLLAEAGVALPAGIDGVPLAERGAPEAAPAPLFSEHRLRLAVVLGDHYYARDREPLPDVVAESVTGGVVPPLPPRSARLGPSGRFAGYDAAGASDEAALEGLVAAFLSRPGGAEAGDERDLDAQTQEALRALGYLE